MIPSVLVSLLLLSSGVLSQSTTGTPTSLVPSRTSSGIVTSPTESIGCVLHVDHWHCDGPAETDHDHKHEEEGHEGHDHTEEEHAVGEHAEEDHDQDHDHEDHDHAAESTGTPTSNDTLPPAPTESTGCVSHGDHWHCSGSLSSDAHAEEAHSEESGECIVHTGHSHGDCTAAQLACNAILLENYNLPLHIGAVFIVLVTSAIGFMFPMISGWIKRSDGSNAASGNEVAFGRKYGFLSSFFFILKHFGTGILLSTAFIHLLYHGFVMFNNECLGELVYESASSAIAMAAALVTFFLDYAGTRYAATRFGNKLSGSVQSTDEKAAPHRVGSQDSANEKGIGSSTVDPVVAAQKSWNVLLLEGGIVFHSIMIGITLGSSSGAGWSTLLIVIIFHQAFEATALGARIALLYWMSRLKAFLLGLIYILITPVGIAIGIGIRHHFSQNGKAALLSVGILNSISGGILAYTAFKLLLGDFIDGPLKNAALSKVAVALCSLLGGVIAMSVLGKWA